MNFPLISEYIDSILYAEDNFATLSNLRPILDEDGRPIMSSGNFAVVFKMNDIITHKEYAVKCFIKDQVGRNLAYKKITEELANIDSSFFVNIKYYENELFVDSNNSDESEFPVVVMDWVDGHSLEYYYINNKFDSIDWNLIFCSLFQLAFWLNTKPFAHGDIKPDNIIVRNDGSLVLVDYDGMYVPSMKGQCARENGTPDYTLPYRTIDDFDNHIDDFALLTLMLKIKSLVVYPSSNLTQLGQEDYISINKSAFIKNVYPSYDKVLNSLVHNVVSILICGSYEKSYDFLSNFIDTTLEEVSLSATKTPKEKKLKTYGGFMQENRNENSTFPNFTFSGCLFAASDYECYGIDGPSGEPLEWGWNDMCVPPYIYCVANHAFAGCNDVNSIELSSSLKIVGDNAFTYCKDLNYIVFRSPIIWSAPDICDRNVIILVPDTTSELFKSKLTNHKEQIWEYTQWANSTNTQITIIDHELQIEDGDYVYSPDKTKIIKYLGNESIINIPEGVITICDSAFAGKTCSIINMPNSVTNIGARAFYRCQSLHTINLSKQLQILPPDVFGECYSLQSISLPDSIETIQSLAFGYCKTLFSVKLPRFLKRLDDNVFAGCENLSNIELPCGLYHIGEGCFERSSLKSIELPDSVNYLGDSAFRDCKLLEHVVLSDSLTDINKYLFYQCINLKSVNIPYRVERICDEAFSGCENKKLTIKLPSNLREIGYEVFEGISIDNIDVSKSSFEKDTYALYTSAKTELITVLKKSGRYTIPSSVKKIRMSSVYDCFFDKIVIPESVKSIEQRAFCRGKITNIYITSMIDIDPGSFYPCVGTIYVPAGLFEYYNDILKRITKDGFTYPGTHLYMNKHLEVNYDSYRIT